MSEKQTQLLLRLWQAPNGNIKYSVKRTEGGEPKHFADIEALSRYLSQIEEREFNLLKEEGLR